MKVFPEFSTCDFCDTHKNSDNSVFKVLPPIFQNFGGKVSFKGQITTVQCHEDNSCVKAAVESDGKGRVLVVDGGGSLRRALLGGNLAAAAARNGWAGLVINGAVRDVAELAVCETGIMALALVPMPTQRRNEGQRDIEIQIQGMSIRSGEWLYADADGIVIAANALI